MPCAFSIENPPGVPLSHRTKKHQKNVHGQEDNIALVVLRYAVPLPTHCCSVEWITAGSKAYSNRRVLARKRAPYLLTPSIQQQWSAAIPWPSMINNAIQTTSVDALTDFLQHCKNIPLNMCTECVPLSSLDFVPPLSIQTCVVLCKFDHLFLS